MMVLVHKREKNSIVFKFILMELISFVFYLKKTKAMKLQFVKEKKYCVFNLHIHFSYFLLLRFTF